MRIVFRLKPTCITGAALLWLAVPQLKAQEKQDISFDQAFNGKTTGITIPLPAVRGWADADHYIEIRDKQAYSIDVRTGNATVYTAPVGGPHVDIHHKDIFYTGNDGKEIQLTSSPEEEKNPTLSPDGKFVAFTRNNDLYSIEIATKKEIRYTHDGTDVIYNGWASWVYYEEILGRPTRYRAFWWSPDSKHIAYMHFDDTKVPVFPIYSEKGQHGYLENTRYPKAGDPNPAVKLGMVAVEGGKTVWADFNENDDQYFGTPFWTADSKNLWIQWMPRSQDNLKIYSINPESGAKKEVYDEKQKTWINWFTDVPFIGAQGFLLQSDKTGWSQLYLHNMDGSLKKQLTNGNWTVKEVLQIDEKNQVIYFTARKEASTRFDLYKVSLKTGALTRLTSGNYNNTISMAPGGKYFITTYSNLSTPSKMALVDNNGKVIRELGDSKGPDFDKFNVARTALKYYKTRDGLELPMTITMPLHMQPGKKYPILISIYGGPNAGTVYDTWKYTPVQQWWAQEGVIQVAIDNRSSGHLGKTGMNYIHRKLGIYEIEDYMDATKWLRSQEWADTAKVCMTGGSFGGYMTCMAMTYGADVFNYGMANFAVTDWHLYDSHYTERYMDTPAENPEGYKVTAVMPYVNKYHGLIRITHGTMDDNVHMQNCIQLIDEMENQNKHFEFMLYPGERHGWGAPKNVHSNSESYRFIYNNLLNKPFPAGFNK
ncbi:dipeptidyl-peptidase-4 [Chitinophaga dinghuensis]|uniref:Dipeptidyl-peptidase-4 n=1 Tax=Chitinophaga dinghuensis TaxID=1539050 RepID=A0A327VPH2_9BACT|nr:S9 family peptidase [Chitinophaga dinghuensis]RAJ75438.1 dipeptidyl-peptidase-4 [Chitinophaga dinghuensis]